MRCPQPLAQPERFSQVASAFDRLQAGDAAVQVGRAREQGGVVAHGHGGDDDDVRARRRACRFQMQADAAMQVAAAGIVGHLFEGQQELAHDLRVALGVAALRGGDQKFGLHDHGNAELG